MCQEITISYLGEELLLPTLQRQWLLWRSKCLPGWRDGAWIYNDFQSWICGIAMSWQIWWVHWGFICRCPRCESPEDSRTSNLSGVSGIFPPTVGGAHISWVGWKHKSCNCNTLKRIYGTFKQRACTQHVRKMCICRRMAHADAHLAFFTLPSLLSMLQKDASVQDPLRDRACNSCAPIPRRWQAWWPWADLLPQIPKRTLEV